MTWRRLKTCVESWPDCWSGGYNPACCRFPKSCSCMADDENTPDYLLEPETEPLQASQHRAIATIETRS